MGLEVIDNSKNMTLSLSADDVGSLEEIKKRIDDFAGFVCENDTFRITVDLTIKAGSVSTLSASPTYIQFFDAYEAHFDSAREMVKHLGISRSSYYCWRQGKPVGHHGRRMLITKAPTAELKVAAQQLFKKTIA